MIIFAQNYTQYKIMKFAIIAAGEGSRLTAEGVKMPKPLVQVAGEKLIDRLIRIFMQNDATEIVVICNDITTMVSRHLINLQKNGLNGTPVPLRFVVKSTPSSMHSFYEISPYICDGPFCLTTVDTIFNEQTFSEYIKTFRQLVNENIADGLMGVTDYIDDEKPLYVGTDGDLNVTGFFDENHDCKYISGGIYGLIPKAIETLKKCINRGESRMRNFQRGLIVDNIRLKAYPMDKIMDIDHADDILKAETFLQKK